MAATADKKKEALRLLRKFDARAKQLPRPTGLAFYKPQPTDLIVATYPKAGTTLLQYMVYQVVVASGGAPPFDPDGTRFFDINEVAPWLEFGPEFGITEGATNPRIFKSHLAGNFFDKDKSKFIYCIRNPMDYPASLLDFVFDPLFGSEVTDDDVRQEILNEFTRLAVLGYPPSTFSPTMRMIFRLLSKILSRSPLDTGNWFEFNKSWIEKPHKHVLVLFYEEITTDLVATARKIAAFAGKELSAHALEAIAQRCDRKQMYGDPKFLSATTLKGFDLPANAGIEFVKLENRPGFKQFEIDEEIVNICNEMMFKYFGVRDYQEFREFMKQLHAH